MGSETEDGRRGARKLGEAERKEELYSSIYCVSAPYTHFLIYAPQQPLGKFYSPIFADGESEALRGEMTCPGSGYEVSQILSSQLPWSLLGFGGRRERELQVQGRGWENGGTEASGAQGADRGVGTAPSAARSCPGLPGPPVPMLAHGCHAPTCAPGPLMPPLPQAGLSSTLPSKPAGLGRTGGWA